MSYKRHVALASLLIITGAAGFFVYTVVKEHNSYVAERAAEERAAKVAMEQLVAQIQSVNRKTAECINNNKIAEDTRYLNEQTQLDQDIQRTLVGLPIGVVQRMYNAMSAEIKSRQQNMEIGHLNNYNNINSYCMSNFLCPDRSMREGGNLECALSKRAT